MQWRKLTIYGTMWTIASARSRNV